MKDQLQKQRLSRFLPIAYLLVMSVQSIASMQDAASEAELLNETGMDHDAALTAVLTNIDRVHDQFSTLTARFLQVKSVALLTEPVRNDGWFYFSKPDKLCWEYGEPEPMAMWMNRDTLTIYYPDLKQAEIMDISNYRGRMQQAMGFGQSSSVLKKNYRIQLQDEFTYDPQRLERPQFITPEIQALTKGTLKKSLELAMLELMPKKRTIQKRIDKVFIWINKETWLPQFIQYNQANGDRSTMFLIEVFRDRPIPEEKFQRTLPTDVVIKKMRHSATDE